MNLFFSLVVGALVQAAQYAPSDVPKTHWAYPAVNEMFREGLLKGYPPERSTGAPAARQERKQAGA